MSNTIICIEPLWPGSGECDPYYVSLPEGFHPDSHPPACLLYTSDAADE